MRIEYIEAITHIHLGFEMRRLELIVADLEHLPEGQLRISLCRARFAGVKRNVGRGFTVENRYKPCRSFS